MIPRFIVCTPESEKTILLVVDQFTSGKCTMMGPSFWTFIPLLAAVEHDDATPVNFFHSEFKIQIFRCFSVYSFIFDYIREMVL